MRQATQSPAAPAAAAQPATSNTAGPASAQAMYQAAAAYRKELARQLERLEEQAGDLQRSIAQGAFPDAATKSIAEGRLAALTARIPELDKALAAADLRLASAALVPGATAEPPAERRTNNDAEFVVPIVFIVFVMGPIAAAAAWRWVRRGEVPFIKAASQPAELNDAQAAQLARLTHTVEAMALEIERIGEGQRFLTRVLGDPARPQLAERGVPGEPGAAGPGA